MSEVIDLHHWAAYRFGYEYRLIGYVQRDQGYTCVVTEIITNVKKEDQLVETTDGKVYKPYDVIDKAQRIDMMYVLDRWMNLNNKGSPQEVTHSITESLGRVKLEDG